MKTSFHTAAPGELVEQVFAQMKNRDCHSLPVVSSCRLAPKAGPMKVPADKLRSVLGVTSVKHVQGNSTLAVVDSSLSS